MLQACEGISEAHALGIVHRDIKPSNFFVTHRPDGSSLLKILDFGISKTPAEVSELTGTQTVIGTPTNGARADEHRALDRPAPDIWSMGVVMYQMLAGRPPFEAETYAGLVLKVGNEPPAQLHIPIPPASQGHRCAASRRTRRTGSRTSASSRACSRPTPRSALRRSSPPSARCASSPRAARSPPIRSSRA